MKCRYFFGPHKYGFLTIAPFKEEEVNLSPRIVIYHEVATEGDIDLIKERATPRFKRATVQNYKTGDLETASYRISKTAWLKPEEDERIAKIYQRVGAVTGLNMATSEELQVSNYGIGGHYEPHYDFARREETNAFASLGTGNRIATWLFYVRIHNVTNFWLLFIFCHETSCVHLALFSVANFFNQGFLRLTMHTVHQVKIGSKKEIACIFSQYRIFPSAIDSLK